MNDIQGVLAKNVRHHRKEAGLSQEELAELAGLHRTYIGGIEQRRINVSIKNIGKIATALGVDPAILLLSEESTVSKEVSERRRYSKILHSKHGNLSPDPAEKSDNGLRYALVTWQGEQVIIRPIDVVYEDLTVQILSYLTSSGVVADDLAARYAEIHDEVIAFLTKSR